MKVSAAALSSFEGSGERTVGDVTSLDTMRAYDAFAGFGVDGCLIENAGDLEQALAEAVREVGAGKPYVVEVLTIIQSQLVQIKQQSTINKYELQSHQAKVIRCTYKPKNIINVTAQKPKQQLSTSHSMKVNMQPKCPFFY